MTARSPQPVTRRRLALPSLAVATLLIVSACAGAAATPPPATQPPSSASLAATSSSTPAAATEDWNGFRGDASRSGNTTTGPVGKPVLAWRYQAKSPVPNDIAVVGDRVYFASDDGTVYALDRSTGEEAWVVDAGNPTLVGPFAADGRLYFLNGAGAATALDAATGKTLWTSPTTYDGPSQLVSDKGTLYFGTSDGNLVALDGTTGAEQWKLQPSPSTTKIDSPAAVNGTVYAGTDGGGFVAVDEATHKVAWTGDTKNEDTGTTSVIDGTAYIGAFIDAAGGHLRAFDAATGDLRWTGPKENLGFPAAGDGLVFSATPDGSVNALDAATGVLRWTIQLNGFLRPMAVAGHVLYVAADQENKVYAVDTKTGGKLWDFDVDGSNDCCLAVANGVVYVGSMTGSVYAIEGDGSAVAPQAFQSAPPSAAPPTEAPLAQVAATATLSVPLPPDGVNPICQIAFAPDGRLWVPLGASGTFAIYEPDGTLAETWGSPGTGKGEFDLVRPDGSGYGTLGFAPDGSFYVLDAGNRRVQHFDKDRTYLGEWGGFGQGPGQYSDPVGLVVAADGTVWVLDDRRPALEHYAPDGTVLATVDPYTAEPVNDGSNSLAIDPAGNLYLTLFSPAEVLVFDPAGQYLRTVGKGAFSASEQPTDMAIDAAGHLFVDQGPERGTAPGVLVFGPDGAPLGGFGPLGSGAGELLFPAGMAFDATGALWIMDSLPESARLIRYELPGELRSP